MKHKTDDLRITAIKELASPNQIFEDLPITENAANTVHSTRQAIYNILDGIDDRLVVVIGPCSIHDPKAAMEYAQRLKPWPIN